MNKNQNLGVIYTSKSKMLYKNNALNNTNLVSRKTSRQLLVTLISEISIHN